MTSAIRTSYLSTVFNLDIFPETIKAVVREAKSLQKKYDYDTIAFSGMSGAAIAFVLSSHMSVPLLCVRKKGDSSHFITGRENQLLEGNIGVRKYLIIDDFISSGKTVNYIMDTISKEVPEAKCVAMMMYAAYGEDYNYTRIVDDVTQKWNVVHPRRDAAY